MSQNTRCVTYYIWVVVLLVTAITYYRFGVFQSLEPRMDHATMVTWVKAVFQAQHFLPIGDGDTSWINALETDEDSFLYAVLKPVYTAPTLLFNIVSLVWFSATALITGPSLEAQIAWSIIAHGGMLICLALLPLEAIKWGNIEPAKAISVSAFALLAALTTSFLHLFSPLGTHNVGLLTLLLSTLFITRYLHHFRTGNHGVAPLFWAITTQTMACYAMYTNVFLIPAATVCVLLFAGGQPVRHRITEAARYSFFTFLTFVPAIILMTVGIIYPHSEDDIGSFSGMFEWAFASNQSNLFDYLTTNFLHWIDTLSNSYSLAGLILGGFGLVLFARHFKIYLPLSLVIIHLWVWTGMALFANTRTPAYVLPFLALGCAYLLYYTAWQLLGPRMRKKNAALILLLLLVSGGLGWHYRTDTPQLLDPTRSQVWGSYYRSQGLWRPMIHDVDQLLQNAALIVPWNDDVSMMYRSLSQAKNFNTRVFRPLDTLSKAHQEGQLNAYIERRQLAIPHDAHVYFLAPGFLSPMQLTSLVFATLCQPELIKCPHPQLEKIRSWQAHVFYGSEIVLYRLH